MAGELEMLFTAQPGVQSWERHSPGAREPTNSQDRCAVAVKKAGVTVGAHGVARVNIMFKFTPQKI
jgi:hypothetical protein